MTRLVIEDMDTREILFDANVRIGTTLENYEQNERWIYVVKKQGESEE